MCGIIGYIGDGKASSFLYSGLLNMKYRGYDSAGISVMNKGNIKTIKKKGEPENLKEEIKCLEGTTGIAHTRWATHGVPSETNAHPQTDCKSNIYVVHNGIIENYAELKAILETEGHKFQSDTDTEVIAHLIEKFYENDLEKAVFKALKLIEGPYGIAVIMVGEEKIICAKRGSPLILGIGEKEMFVASDKLAFLEHTQNSITLEDNQYAVLENSKYLIRDLNGTVVDPEIERLELDVQQIQKKGYKFFTLKEIMEQPESAINIMRGRINNGRIKLSVDSDIKKINRIIIGACGTSYYAALAGKHYIERFANISVEVDFASEFRYRNPLLSEEDLFIAISQSGETADTLEAIKEAKRKGAKTLGIVNVVGSAIASEVDSGIYLHIGPEIGVASTKAFTSQVISLILLSQYLRQEKGLQIDTELINSLKTIDKSIKQILEQSERIKKIAENYYKYTDFLYLGRGINYVVALEGALKLKELSYIHAEAYPSGEMKHGPLAMINENFPSLVIISKSSIPEKTISNMREIKARNGKIITVTDYVDDEIRSVSDEIIHVPLIDDVFQPIVSNIALQLFAYHIADLKGLNVDQPRNLAKSVTVE